MKYAFLLLGIAALLAWAVLIAFVAAQYAESSRKPVDAVQTRLDEPTAELPQ